MDAAAELSSVKLLKRTKPLVLITDDDRSLQTLLTVAMEQEDFEIVQASSGEQCLHDFQRVQPDMVLLDAVMPGMDGFECCHKLRQLPNAKQVPILMITVLDKPEFVDKAYQAGATDYITKPIQWAVLSQRVHRLLESYKNAQSAEVARHTLTQHQAWEMMQSQLLKAVKTQSLSDFISLSLAQLRDFLGSDRLLLYSASRQPWTEAVEATKELPSLKLEDSSNFVAQAFIEQALEQPVWITDSAGEMPEERYQELGRKLQAQSLGICPVAVGDEADSGGILLALHHRESHEWSELEKLSLQSVADLISIAMRLAN